MQSKQAYLVLSWHTCCYKIFGQQNTTTLTQDINEFPFPSTMTPLISIAEITGSNKAQNTTRRTSKLTGGELLTTLWHLVYNVEIVFQRRTSKQQLKTIENMAKKRSTKRQTDRQTVLNSRSRYLKMSAMNKMNSRLLCLIAKKKICNMKYICRFVFFFFVVVE